MASLSSPLFLCLLLLCLASVHTAFYGKGRLCRSAPFVPGYYIAGRGFDVVTLRQTHFSVNVWSYLDRRGRCKLVRNPLLGNRLQKLPASALFWKSYRSCYTNLYSRSYSSSLSSLVNAYTNLFGFSWRSGLNWRQFSGLRVGGTGSYMYRVAKNRARHDRMSFSLQSLSCTRYSYGVSGRPPLNPRFVKECRKLPVYTTSTRHLYRKFILAYGTHYVKTAYLGGRFIRVSSVRTCLSRLNGYSTALAHFCIGKGVSQGLGLSRWGAHRTRCYKIARNLDLATKYRYGMQNYFTRLTGGRSWKGHVSLINSYYSRSFRYWLNSLKSYPGSVRYYLQPTYSLVHWPRQRAGLKTETERYIKESGFKPSRKPYCGSKYSNRDTNCCPKAAWRGTLKVTVLNAWGLKGDPWGKTEAYVKIRFGRKNYKTRMIRSNSPTWNKTYNLGIVDTRTTLRVEVWDDDWWRDDRLGSNTRSVIQGNHKYKFYAKRGGIWIGYTLTCDSHLTGKNCHQYKPTP